MLRLASVVSLAAVAVPLSAVAENALSGHVSAAEKDEGGVLVHTVTSPYQAGAPQIRVLLPENLARGQRYPVVYVLPVEAGDGNRYGDGLREVIRARLHRRDAAIFVAPTFSHLPWYADHPTDAKKRQESYLLRVVLPYVERTYPVQAEAEGRLLLGFSKSGWGAWSLLLRHPDVFGRAAAWDAPLMMRRLGKYGTKPIFGTQHQFEAYRPADLLRNSAAKLRHEKRLILFGYGGFRSHHRQMHDLLKELQRPHHYRDGPRRKHDWHSGWVKPAMELLLADGEDASKKGDKGR